MPDVIVAGAGPVGCFAAAELERAGLSVLVLERARELGHKACSGLLSPRLAEFVPVQKRWLEHTVRGAIIHGPHGAELRVQKRLGAYVVNRERFTQWLASRLRTRVRTGHAILSLKPMASSIAVKTSKGTFTGKLLLGCDGANSVVRRHFGAHPKELVTGLASVVPGPNPGRMVELWFDKALPDGFFWRIPRGASTEYGMLGSRAQFSQLTAFFPQAAAGRREAALIPIGPCRTVFPRTLLLGDAAGLTKPWSGGGIIYGFACARIAAAIAAEAVAKDDFSPQSLQRYEKEWKRALGASIRFGLLFRRLYRLMGNRAIDRSIRLLAKRTLSKQDMDFPQLDILS